MSDGRKQQRKRKSKLCGRNLFDTIPVFTNFKKYYNKLK